MKVCILTTSFPARKGSTESIFVYELVKHLAKKIKIKVVAPFYENSLFKKEKWGNFLIDRFQYFFPVKYQILTKKGGIMPNLKKSVLAKIQFPLFLFFMFLKGLKVSRKCDLIHAQWSLSGLIGILIKFFNRKPLILTVRGSDINYPIKSKISKKVLQIVLKKCDHVVAVSESLRQKVLSLNIDKGKTSVINNGVDTDLFKKRSKNIVREKLGLPKNKKICLFVGRLIKDKGLKYLIEAFQGLGPQYLLLLIGSYF